MVAVYTIPIDEQKKVLNAWRVDHKLTLNRCNQLDAAWKVIGDCSHGVAIWACDPAEGRDFTINVMKSFDPNVDSGVAFDFKYKHRGLICTRATDGSEAEINAAMAEVPTRVRTVRNK